LVDTVSIDSALVNSDEVTEEITSCNYTLDFISKKCMLFFEGAMIADVGILNIESKGNKHIITLDDSAIETKIILDLDSKNFIYYYAWYWGIGSTLYFFSVTFLKMPEGGRDFANIILGFLLGTAVATIISFFYGSSKSSKDKTDVMVKELK
jgi:hypothetical protein